MESGARAEQIAIVQYAGDYREAYRRLAAGGAEHYYAQRYSVEQLARWTAVAPVATLTCLTAARYEELLPNGVRAIGAGMSARIDAPRLLALLEHLSPTRLVVRTPIPELLAWAIDRAVPTLLTLAETLSSGRRAKLVELLNHPVIERVGCYLPSSAALYEQAGVAAEKVVAWGWPAAFTPADFPRRTSPAAGAARLVYVGALRAEKGLGDAIEAVSRLRKGGADVHLSVFGEGPDAARFRRLVRRRRLRRAVSFGGVLGADAVFARIYDADVAVVPSRTEYPEALPLVLDHALCVGTPAVVSAHPAFVRSLRPGRDALLFPPGDVDALVGCVEALIAGPERWRTISEHSAETWCSLQAGLTWGELIESWLRGSAPEGTVHAG